MKKFILIPVFALLTSNLFAQSLTDIDADYLSSLPESVREDVQDEIENSQKDDEDSIKMRPSTELLKSETVKEWEKFKRENSLNENKSERYGINLFRTMQSSFMPINEPNFGNYILDYGDSLEISLYGGNQKNKVHQLEIKRDGTLFIPDVGSIFLSGMSLESAIKKVTNKINNTFIGLDVEINMSKIRDIKILVSGQVEFPGMYTLSGNSNALQAVNIAGGVRENGTLRSIEVKREGKVISTLDFYEALIYGDLSKITQLQSGDSVYIKSAENLVRAGSGFENQAIFELKENETIDDLVRFSGGINKNVSKINFTLHRFIGSSIETIELDQEQSSSFKLKHFDSVYLPMNFYGSVKLYGEVNRPGIYSIKNGDDIYDLIQRAGGYTDIAYYDAGILTSEKAKKLEAEYLKKSYNDIITALAQNPARIQQATNIGLILEEAKNIEPTGRVITEFDLDILSNDERARTFLNDKDEIYIPKLENVVYVFGDVKNPSTLSYSDFMKPEEYIERAGGLDRFADKSYIYVVHPNGEAKVVKINNGFSKLLASSDNDIYPGSLIFVPKRIGSVQGVEFYSTVAPIFSSLALSLASLNSIK